MTTRRGLVAAVPALGLVGALTALSGGQPDPAAVASGSPATTGPITGPITGQITAARFDPAVTRVAADATRAAGRVAEQRIAQERRALRDVVEDVRAQARERTARAAAQGRAELDAFHRGLATTTTTTTAQVPAPRPAPSTPVAARPEPTPEDSGDPRRGPRCGITGLPPVFGERSGTGESVGRPCGLVDLLGRARSADPWADGEPASVAGR